MERYVFPRIVNNISISDEDYTFFEEGNMLCIDIEKEPLFCEIMDEEPNTCEHNITMEIVYFDNQKSLFSVVQKAIGESKAVKLKFTITKQLDTLTSNYEVNIDWREEFVR